MADFGNPQETADTANSEIPSAQPAAQSSSALHSPLISEEHPADDRMAASPSPASMSLLPLVFLTLVTFGLFIPIWFLLRRKFLNSLGSTEKLGITGPALATLLHSVCLLAAFADAAGAHPVYGVVGRILIVVVGSVTLVLAFKVRRILEQHSATPPSLIATFFLTIIYLQHQINQIPLPIEPVQLPVEPEPRLASQDKLELAIASFILGILSVCLSFMVVGGLFGLTGLFLGIPHLRRRRVSSGMAWWGIGLSVVGMTATTGFAIIYYLAFQSFFQQMMSMRQSMASFDDQGASSLRAWEGVRAPDISVTSLDGQTLEMSDLKGKRVVLEFWATWCPPCIEGIPHLNQLAREEEDLVILGISGESESVLRPFAREHGIEYPIVSASHLPSPYGDVHGLPTAFFIDRNGVIQSISVGAQEPEELRAMALAEDYEGAPKDAPELASGSPGGEDMNARHAHGWTPFLHAADGGDTDKVQALLASGADVNSKLDGGWTALLLAANRGHAETVETLLDAGADMNAETGDRWTALAFAAQGGHTESVQILLASGAGDRDFALQRAAQHGHTETVQVLLSQGADVDAKTAAGGLP